MTKRKLPLQEALERGALFRLERRLFARAVLRFILPIKPARSREFNPFHRKHHKASNASSGRRSNKTVFGGCFQCFASLLGKGLLLLPENAVSYPSNSRQCRNTTTATAYTMIVKFLSLARSIHTRLRETV